jgi:hypothetical protein
MLLRMLCEKENLSGDQIIRIGQLLLGLGLLCNSASILLDRFTGTHDFFLGFLTGFGLVSFAMALIFHVKGVRLKRAMRK